MSSRALAGIVLSLIAVVAMPAAGRQRPDFSGRWTLDAPAPPPQGQRAGGPGARPASGDLGSGWGSTITIGQSTAALTVEYAFFTRGDMQPPITFTFALDGSETKNTVMMGHGFQVERSKASWDGQALVLTTLHDFTDPSTGKPAIVEVARRLSLETPDTLIVETTRGPALGGPASTTRTTYRRAAAGG